jgi:electron transfer flavoprotein alpha subunit
MGPILVLVPASREAATADTLSVIGLGQRLARESRGEVQAAILQSRGTRANTATAIARFTDAVHVADAPWLDDDDDELYPLALAEIVRRISPGLVLVPDSAGLSHLVPSLAEHLEATALTRCDDVNTVAPGFEVVCSMYGGLARARYQVRADGLCVLALNPQANAAALPGSEPGPVTTMDVQRITVSSKVHVTRRVLTDAPGLANAQVVVAGGGGLRTEDDFRRVEQMAEVLGGVAGSSKVPIVRGWARPGQKIGLTGTSIAPTLYLTFGISGASQHMAGCSRAKMVVAVNVDRRAPVFHHATYGVIGDANALLPVLIDALTAARPGNKP